MECLLTLLVLSDLKFIICSPYGSSHGLAGEVRNGRKQRHRTLGDRDQTLPQLWMNPSESHLSAKHTNEQVTRIVSTLGKRVVLKSLKRQRDEVIQPDLLPDGDAQILHREIS